MTNPTATRGSITATVEIRGPDGKLKHELYLTSDIEVNDELENEDYDEPETEGPIDGSLAP